jgi:hypothetical protein
MVGRSAIERCDEKLSFSAYARTIPSAPTAVDKGVGTRSSLRPEAIQLATLE